MRIFSIIALVGLVAFSTQAQVANFASTAECFGSPTTLTETSSLDDTAIASWDWDLDGDGIREKTGPVVISVFPSSGTFNVSLRVTPVSGAPDSLSIPVIVHPTPLVNFHVDNVCIGVEAVYIDDSDIDTSSGSTIDQWIWDFNLKDTIDGNAFGNIVTHVNDSVGTFITKLTCVTSQSCTAFATKTTEVFDQPFTRFAVQDTILGDNTLFINQTLSFANDIAFFLWDFGDGNSLIKDNPKHRYNSTDTFNVKLLAVTENNCRDSTSEKVIISPFSSLENLPEIGKILILTPNNDGFNDVFEVEGLKTAKFPCELLVYNIWNDLVYSNSEWKGIWDGKSDGGNELGAGAYFYILRCTAGNETHEEIGNINILR